MTRKNMRRLSKIASIMVTMTLQSLLGLKIIGSLPPEDLPYPTMPSNKGEIEGNSFNFQV